MTKKKQKTLRELLLEVDKLFPTRKRVVFDQNSFSLVRNQRGFWSFSITDDWHKWLNKGLELHFHLWEEPENAVREFLEYVRENKIDVSKLSSIRKSRSKLKE